MNNIEQWKYTFLEARLVPEFVFKKSVFEKASLYVIYDYILVVIIMNSCVYFYPIK